MRKEWVLDWIYRSKPMNLLKSFLTGSGRSFFVEFNESSSEPKPVSKEKSIRTNENDIYLLTYMDNFVSMVCNRLFSYN